VCAYSLDELPTSWVQVFRRCERAFARAKLAVRVRLYPLEDLPETFEVLIVAPEIRERAVAVARGARVIATTREGALDTIGELIREIETGESLSAERAVAGGPKVVVIRGGEEL
jgi:hypothetical protein